VNARLYSTADFPVCSDTESRRELSAANHIEPASSDTATGAELCAGATGTASTSQNAARCSLPEPFQPPVALWFVAQIIVVSAAARESGGTHGAVTGNECPLRVLDIRWTVTTNLIDFQLLLQPNARINRRQSTSERRWIHSRLQRVFNFHSLSRQDRAAFDDSSCDSPLSSVIGSLTCRRSLEISP
jgi:hypothetical protein